MERVTQALDLPKDQKKKIVWSLMCPDESPGLSNVYGKNFDELYQSYEKKGSFKI